MSKRKKPGALRVTVGVMPEQDPQEAKLGEMHDALYTLGDKIRKPFPRHGEKLLPKGMQSTETPESKAARDHIDTLHKAMSEAKKK